MSKSRKTKRQVMLATPRAGKPKFYGLALAAVSILVVFGIWLWTFNSANMAPPAKSLTGAGVAKWATAERGNEFQQLTGRWQRPDGGYVLEIKSIAGSGAMDAGYYNPKSIRVAKAEASRGGDSMNVFIELRDVNYPGSTYTLTYDSATDLLKGIYYQAAENQRFPVAFVRMKQSTP